MKHRTPLLSAIGAIGFRVGVGIGVCAAVGGLGVGTLLPAQAFAADYPVLETKVYDRAAQFLASNQDKLVFNASFTPHWRRGPKERFTYRREFGDGRADFVEVAAATGTRAAAFDQAIVAEGLSKVLGQVVETQRLPFQDYEEIAVDQIGFAANGRNWNCSTRRADCAEKPASQTDPTAIASPDGRWLAFIDNGNLWIRSTDGKIRFPLTTDAMPHYGYAAGRIQRRRGRDGCCHARACRQGWARPARPSRAAPETDRALVAGFEILVYPSTRRARRS